LRLRDFPLLTDENIHPGVVRSLRDHGLDVLDAKESRLVGVSDLVILHRAYAEDRVVLTHDSDFGQLAVVASEPIVGIVYLRPGHFDPAFTLETLRILFEQVLEVERPFIVVAQRVVEQIRIRVRRL
jgi:predicted nuclease of predicted toxin-antitoxin system